jgi:hypothetical protein
MLAVVVATTVIVAIGFSGSATGGGGPRARASAVLSGEFVGRRSIGAFIAVVANRARSGPRNVHAYICDGRHGGRAEWFKAVSRSNSFDLRAVRGADRIRFTLHPRSVTGTITLRGGQRIPFRLVRARNGAGLYHVRQTASGRWFGTSEGGNRINAHDRSGRRVIGTVTLRNGRRIPYRVRQARGSGGVDRYTAIVIPPYGVKGRGGEITLGMPSARTYLGTFIM